MFIVNDKIRFTFKHFRNLNVTLMNGNEVSDCTYCSLEVNGKTYTAMAACSKLDAFCAETGRKIALTRALKQAGLDKVDRGNVWTRYFCRRWSNKSWLMVLDKLKGMSNGDIQDVLQRQVYNDNPMGGSHEGTFGTGEEGSSTSSEHALWGV